MGEAYASLPWADVNWLRRLVVMILGVVLIVEAVAGKRLAVFQFTVGLVMVGLIPIDYIIDVVSRPAHDEAEITRLQQVMEERATPPEP
jgi:hypothetical protein